MYRRGIIPYLPALRIVHNPLNLAGVLGIPSQQYFLGLPGLNLEAPVTVSVLVQPQLDLEFRPVQIVRRSRNHNVYPYISDRAGRLRRLQPAEPFQCVGPLQSAVLPSPKLADRKNSFGRRHRLQPDGLEVGSPETRA